MGLHLSVARAAMIAPHGVAMRSEGREQTWADTAARVARLAGGLLALGPAPGDRVALLAANAPEHLEFTYAVMWAGLVVVPLNTRLSIDEHCEIIAHAQAFALAVDRRHAARAREIAQRLGIRLIEMEIGAIGDDHRVPGDCSPVRPFMASSAHPAGLYYTGGTTGRAKGVELSHGAFHARSVDICADMGFDAQSVYLHAAPYFHLADAGVGHGLTFAAGTHVFLPDYSPTGVLRAIAEEGVNTLNLVPTMLADLITTAGAEAILPKVRAVAYGAAPISNTLLRRLLTAFPHATFRQFYGQTEACGPCSVLSPECHRPDSPKLASAGRATASSLLRIVSPNGKELPRGSAGEIQTAGPGNMTSYWREPERTLEALSDGWLKTGDIGIMDEDGFVTIVDRLKDMIVTGGENVFSAEVENALASHASVAAVSGFGIPDERWGEAVHAVVVLSSGNRASQEELIAHARQEIASYKCPKRVTFAEALPLSPLGKVRKDLLRQELLQREHQAESVDV